MSEDFQDTSRTQGVGRLVVGLLAAAGMAATMYGGQEPATAILAVAAFGLAWSGARAWLRMSKTGFWRVPIGWGWMVFAVGLGPFLAHIAVAAMSTEVLLGFLGVDAALISGLMLSIWFSPHRYELFQ
jgi:hypothetical protein